MTKSLLALLLVVYSTDQSPNKRTRKPDQHFLACRRVTAAAVSGEKATGTKTKKKSTATKKKKETATAGSAKQVPPPPFPPLFTPY